MTPQQITWIIQISEVSNRKLEFHPVYLFTLQWPCFKIITYSGDEEITDVWQGRLTERKKKKENKRISYWEQPIEVRQPSGSAQRFCCCCCCCYLLHSAQLRMRPFSQRWEKTELRRRREEDNSRGGQTKSKSLSHSILFSPLLMSYLYHPIRTRGEKLQAE